MGVSLVPRVGLFAVLLGGNAMLQALLFIAFYAACGVLTAIPHPLSGIVVIFCLVGIKKEVII